MSLLALLLLTETALALVPNASYHFEQYLSDHRKIYHLGDERGMRQSLFYEELNLVMRHNSKMGRTWTAGINHMSDWTPEEKAALRGYDRHTGRAHRAAYLEPGSPSVLRSNMSLVGFPASVDWRLQTPPVVTPVKDQGGCGSCWTFATAETIESRYAIATGILWSLSEQQVASCASNPRHCGGSGGCQGGTAQVGFQHAIDADGLLSEWSYPYTSHGGLNANCTLNVTRGEGRVAAVQSFVNVQTNDEASLLEAVNQGPVAIAVDASSWSRYDSGVFDGCNTTSPLIDHAVQLVGYGEERSIAGEAIGYWIVRNSWTPIWGESGYIRILRGGSEGRACGTDTEPTKGQGCQGGPKEVKVCGMCGVLYDNAYPVVRKV